MCVSSAISTLHASDAEPKMCHSYPLEAPAVPADAKPEDVPKPQPILGHVSLLNTLALIPADPAHGLARDWIATGDRDEHVRISRFPAGHVIEKFAWGSKRCVPSPS